MLRVSGWTASENQIYENLINEAMFRTRCCIPCIVQSYNEENNTVECQPAIRERIINEDGTIQYVQLPLLVNVPVVFPGSSDFELKFALKQNDECLVLFSDLSIDNFWEKGSLQNPVEVRRHDLSDGIAIPCRLSLQKRSEQAKASIVVSSKGDIILNSSKGDIIFNSASGTFNSDQLYKIIYSHYHKVVTPTGAFNTTSPLGVDE